VNECEKIDLSSHVSTALPSMREAKCSFNPCLFCGYIYLYGGENQLMEAFSTRTDSFLPLLFPLPEASSCCLYVCNSFLIVHSYRYISKFAAGNAGQLLSHSQVEAQMSVNKYSNSQPVLDCLHGLFWIVQENRCICMDMDTGAQVQSFA